jgi:hypothetical protein
VRGRLAAVERDALVRPAVCLRPEAARDRLDAAVLRPLAEAPRAEADLAELDLFEVDLELLLRLPLERRTLELDFAREPPLLRVLRLDLAAMVLSSPVPIDGAMSIAPREDASPSA